MPLYSKAPRPILDLPVLSKLLERIVHKLSMAQLVASNMLLNLQLES